MAFAHDSVRVLQCFIQFGSHEQRQEVFDELKGGAKIFLFMSAVALCVCDSVIPSFTVCRSSVVIIR